MEKQPLFWLRHFSLDGKVIFPTFPGSLCVPIKWGPSWQHRYDLTQTCRERIRGQNQYSKSFQTLSLKRSVLESCRLTSKIWRWAETVWKKKKHYEQLQLQKTKRNKIKSEKTNDGPHDFREVGSPYLRSRLARLLELRGMGLTRE